MEAHSAPGFLGRFLHRKKAENSSFERPESSEVNHVVPLYPGLDPPRVRNAPELLIDTSLQRDLYEVSSDRFEKYIGVLRKEGRVSIQQPDQPVVTLTREEVADTLLPFLDSQKRHESADYLIIQEALAPSLTSMRDAVEWLDPGAMILIKGGGKEYTIGRNDLLIHLESPEFEDFDVAFQGTNPAERETALPRFVKHLKKDEAELDVEISTVHTTQIDG